eukprot:PhM_4_TR13660/c0_g1_i1/m.26981
MRRGHARKRMEGVRHCLEARRAYIVGVRAHCALVPIPMRRTALANVTRMTIAEHTYVCHVRARCCSQRRVVVQDLAADTALNEVHKEEEAGGLGRVVQQTEVLCRVVRGAARFELSVHRTLHAVELEGHDIAGAEHGAVVLRHLEAGDRVLLGGYVAEEEAAGVTHAAVQIIRPRPQLRLLSPWYVDDTNVHRGLEFRRLAAMFLQADGDRCFSLERQRLGAVRTEAGALHVDGEGRVHELVRVLRRQLDVFGAVLGAERKRARRERVGVIQRPVLLDGEFAENKKELGGEVPALRRLALEDLRIVALRLLYDGLHVEHTISASNKGIDDVVNSVTQHIGIHRCQVGDRERRRFQKVWVDHARLTRVLERDLAQVALKASEGNTLLAAVIAVQEGAVLTCEAQRPQQWPHVLRLGVL